MQFLNVGVLGYVKRRGEVSCAHLSDSESDNAMTRIT